MFVIVCCFIAEKIFLVEPKVEGGGGRGLGLFYFLILSMNVYQNNGSELHTVRPAVFGRISNIDCVCFLSFARIAKCVVTCILLFGCMINKYYQV
jgi:hypothetical protein